MYKEFEQMPYSEKHIIVKEIGSVCSKYFAGKGKQGIELIRGYHSEVGYKSKNIDDVIFLVEVEAVENDSQMQRLCFYIEGEYYFSVLIEKKDAYKVMETIALFPNTLDVGAGMTGSDVGDIMQVCAKRPDMRFEYIQTNTAQELKTKFEEYLAGDLKLVGAAFVIIILPNDEDIDLMDLRGELMGMAMKNSADTSDFIGFQTCLSEFLTDNFSYQILVLRESAQSCAARMKKLAQKASGSEASEVTNSLMIRACRTLSALTSDLLKHPSQRGKAHKPAGQRLCIVAKE